MRAVPSAAAPLARTLRVVAVHGAPDHVERLARLLLHMAPAYPARDGMRLWTRAQDLIHDAALMRAHGERAPAQGARRMVARVTGARAK